MPCSFLYLLLVRYHPLVLLDFASTVYRCSLWPCWVSLDEAHPSFPRQFLGCGSATFLRSSLRQSIAVDFRSLIQSWTSLDFEAYSSGLGRNSKSTAVDCTKAPRHHCPSLGDRMLTKRNGSQQLKYIGPNKCTMETKRLNKDVTKVQFERRV